MRAVEFLGPRTERHGEPERKQDAVTPIVAGKGSIAIAVLPVTGTQWGGLIVGVQAHW